MRVMRIDFIKSPSQPVVGWVLLLSGLMVLAWVGVQYLYVREMQAVSVHVQQQRAQVQADQERLRLSALPPRVLPYMDDRRWLRAVSELSLPWLSTLKAVERATKPPVFLVGFKSDPVSGRLQLDAEAPGLDFALNYVATLSAASALAQTQLLVHEEVTDTQGLPLVRFSVQTQWVVP